MNTYDLACPAGVEPSADHEPREGEAIPGTPLDDLYAERYRLLATGPVDDDVTLALGTLDDETDPDVGVTHSVAQAVADETPPEARRPRMGDSRRKAADVAATPQD